VLTIPKLSICYLIPLIMARNSANVTAKMSDFYTTQSFKITL